MSGGLNLKYVEGGITAPAGFTASGVKSGCKEGKKDLALIYSETPCNVAGVYTLNKVKAAPLLLTQERVDSGTSRALVVNSGYANACTGEQGMKDARQMTEEVARVLNVKPEEVLVSSTGVIGQFMPMDKILSGIGQAAGELGPGGGQHAAEAILTTDTVIKEAAVTFEAGRDTFTIGGMAKGSGMIHPNMATMLGFLTTDAPVSPDALQAALSEATGGTFNMITVDGTTSTNDMVLAMSNGVSGKEEITKDSEYYEVFKEALTGVCTNLAVMIAKDGEGATKLLEVRVVNARSTNDARLAAREVTSSSLVKSAIFGEDANWGRVLCSVGHSGAEFDPEKIDIYIGNVQVAENGGGLSFSEEKAAEVLSEKHVVIEIDMKEGECNATSWGCDLTFEYITINAEYRT